MKLQHTTNQELIAQTTDTTTRTVFWIQQEQDPSLEENSTYDAHHVS